MLSKQEATDLEAILEKNPEMKARLEVLKNQSEVLGKPAWQRIHLERGSRSGSRTRYTTLLPALLMLVVVLMVAQHWFSRPGENSTFTMSDGNGSGVEILYNAKSGWRYLNADYTATDSLTFSIRDEGRYHVAVAAVYGRGQDAEVVMVFGDAPDRVFDRKSPKPVFLPVPKAASAPTATGDSGRAALVGSATIAPTQIIVFYDDAPLPELSDANVLDLLFSHGNERGGLDFQYQVFSAGR
ncbi:MAG: hypothetical protein ABIW76_21940 [Fibrobacteria bacterium]